MKRACVEGAKLIVIDPRRIDMVSLAACQGVASFAATPGTNVAIVTALAHVIVTEGLFDEAFIASAATGRRSRLGDPFVSEPHHSPEAIEQLTGVPAEEVRGAARLFATGGNGAIYYGLGVTEHSQGSTTGHRRLPIWPWRPAISAVRASA